MSRKTKTICTIGPASEKPEILEKLIESGMDIARVNFSHASYEEFLVRVEMIREFSKKHKKDVKILADLQGPRMRVGKLPEAGIELKNGQEVWFTTSLDSEDAIHINDPYIHQDVEVGQPMFLSSGEIELKIVEKQGDRFKTVVEHGGILYSRKGVNLPNTDLTTKGLTPKDIQDAAYVTQHGADWVAMSFVKDKEDLLALRKVVGDKIKIVSKIERKQALANLDEIIEASDIIMVARGDLGVELPPEDLPLVQKDMIKRAKKQGKLSIVATQMLLSMVNHPHPTRAEISDVANAVLDGAEIVMLSDETAFGKYPVEALKYLVRAASKVEEFREPNSTLRLIYGKIRVFDPVAQRTEQLPSKE